MNYALLPHAGDWKTAKLWAAGTAWNEPLVARLRLCDSETVAREQSLLAVDDADWEIPTLRIHDGKILMRLFNSSADSRVKTLHLGTLPARIELVQLNGETVKTLSTRTDATGRSVFQVALPPMGIGTLRITR